jgi:hypothetical protein
LGNQQHQFDKITLLFYPFPGNIPLNSAEIEGFVAKDALNGVQSKAKLRVNLKLRNWGKRIAIYYRIESGFQEGNVAVKEGVSKI